MAQLVQMLIPELHGAGVRPSVQDAAVIAARIVPGLRCEEAGPAIAEAGGLACCYHERFLVPAVSLAGAAALAGAAPYGAVILRARGTYWIDLPWVDPAWTDACEIAAELVEGGRRRWGSRFPAARICDLRNPARTMICRRNGRTRRVADRLDWLTEGDRSWTTVPQMAADSADRLGLQLRARALWRR